jgi:hypothetical protein
MATIGVSVHRFNEADVIRNFGRMGHKLTHPGTTMPLLGKLKL